MQIAINYVLYTVARLKNCQLGFIILLNTLISFRSYFILTLLTFNFILFCKAIRKIMVDILKPNMYEFLKEI